MKNILILGCGHMGSALLNAWLLSKKYSLTVVDPRNIKNLKPSVNKFKKVNDIKKFVKFDFIIFAMRPADLVSAIDSLKEFNFSKRTVIISIVAGKKIKNFENKLINIKQISRVMPNMPAMIGEGLNCIVNNRYVSKKNRKQIDQLFQYTGKTIFFKTENQLDMATAVSGSGPGYIFNLIDAMEKAAIKLGFEKGVANKLVIQTFSGSINMLIKNKLISEELVKKVATKGGTTEAGLKIMKQNKIHDTFFRVLKASYKKAKKQ